MRTALITASFVALHLATPTCYAAEGPAGEQPVVCTVLGKRITAAEIGLQCDAEKRPIVPSGTTATGPLSGPLEELRARIGREVAQDYVEKNGLKATDEEVREYWGYQDRFMAQDRARRARQMGELESKLQDPALTAVEKAKAEKNLATLLRLASRDKRRDAEKGQRTDEALRAIAAPWIEGWKFNRSVYDRYGGAVSTSKFGPEPVEAVKRLLEEHVKRGELTIHDDNLRRAFWEHIGLPPRTVAKPAEVDFTPYWKRPIPENAE